MQNWSHAQLLLENEISGHCMLQHIELGSMELLDWLELKVQHYISILELTGVIP